MVLDNTYDALLCIFPPSIMSKINQIIDEIQFDEQNVKYRTHYRKFQ